MPEMRAPVGIVRGEPAEGAIATAAKSTSTSARTARFQSAILTKETATRFIERNVTAKVAFPRTMQARQRARLRHVERAVDVVVVGAGILGLAVARELLLRRPKLDLVVLEKEDAVGRHQTGHNSGVIHSGIYYAPGSLKARLCTEGRELMYRYCDKRGIEYERCGKIVVATASDELPRLAELHRRAVANGVEVEELGPERLAELEPHVAGIKALHASETGIVDFRRVAQSLAHEVRSAGGAIRTGEEVVDLRRDGDGTLIETTDDRLRAGAVVTCAGLHSDRLAVMTGAPASPKIVPFRGSYHVLRPEARTLVNRLVYPVVDPACPSSASTSRSRSQETSGLARTRCSPSRGRAIASETCGSPTSGRPSATRASMPSRSATGVRA